MKLTMHRLIQELNGTEPYADTPLPTGVRLTLRRNRRRMLTHYADYEPLYQENIKANIKHDENGVPVTLENGSYDFINDDSKQAFAKTMDELLGQVIEVDIDLVSQDEFSKIETTTDADIEAFAFMIDGESVEEAHISKGGADA